MKINKKSAWEKADIEAFLESSAIPMRLACNDTDGTPFICSLWFMYDNENLWAATHKSSYLVKALLANANVGFEIATNEFPYRGVRGKGTVLLSTERGAQVLSNLTDKYLGQSNQPLTEWLLSRADDEYVLKIQIRRINAWDFSNRMTK